MLGFQRANVPG